jgi:hypothetical protein
MLSWESSLLPLIDQRIDDDEWQDGYDVEEDDEGVYDDEDEAYEDEYDEFEEEFELDDEPRHGRQPAEWE